MVADAAIYLRMDGREGEGNGIGVPGRTEPAAQEIGREGSGERTTFGGEEVG